ncbi:MAG: SIMPL domain-containing protein, partial [Deinococcales bacterium]
MHSTRHPATHPHATPVWGALGPLAPFGRALALGLLIVAGLGLAAPGYAQAAPQAGLLVHGTGTAYGEPDLAVLTMGAEVVEPQVQAALTQADKTMAAVRDVFLNGGVQAKDIRTAAFNVWREDIRDRNGNITGERYHVVHIYSVTVRDLGSVGKLLAAAVQAG